MVIWVVSSTLQGFLAVRYYVYIYSQHTWPCNMSLDDSKEGNSPLYASSPRGRLLQWLLTVSTLYTGCTGSYLNILVEQNTFACNTLTISCLQSIRGIQPAQENLRMADDQGTWRISQQGGYPVQDVSQSVRLCMYSPSIGHWILVLLEAQTNVPSTPLS